ncbi:hypothetical protein J7E49_21500 [Variovorax paradoxus]|nr:hypothetical protein [Variovorax paradoxus]
MSMNYYGDADVLPASYGNESLLRQQARLRDREAELKERMKEARTATTPQGQMVGNGGFQHYVPPHWTQQLSPLAAQIATEAQKKGLEADQTGYDAIEMADAKKHMASMPSDDAPQAVKLQWAEQGKQIPALRSLMTDYAKDQLVAAPERQAQREAKKDLATQSQAEKAAAQAREIEYRRERDTSNEQMRRDLAGDSNDLRRTLAHAVRAAGGGGGDKASNYQLITGDDGTVTRVNKLTGETNELPTKAGKSQASLVKDQLEKSEQRTSSAKALEQLNDAERLLKTATGSKVGSLRDTIAAAAGISTDGAKAAAQLDTIAGNLASNVPRLGGATSDADLRFYKEQAGQLGNRDLPTETRLAALKQVRKFHERALRGPPTGATEPPPAKRGGSVDDLVNKYLK